MAGYAFDEEIQTGLLIQQRSCIRREPSHCYNTAAAGMTRLLPKGSKLAILEENKVIVQQARYTCDLHVKDDPNTMQGCLILFLLSCNSIYWSIYQSDGVMEYELAVVERPRFLSDDVHRPKRSRVLHHLVEATGRLICVACTSHNSDNNSVVSLQSHFGQNNSQKDGFHETVVSVSTATMLVLCVLSLRQHTAVRQPIYSSHVIFSFGKD